jgi:hypothetical protein
MTTIITPIQITGELSPQYMMVDVTTKPDAMEEVNLVSVVCYFSRKELIHSMDSVSKQRVLHNLSHNVNYN